MNRIVMMTALALVLAVSSARADYTGNGAISSGASAPTAAVTQTATDAKDGAKGKWEKFKNDHEQTWEKLEAARRAHWHGISMHVSKGQDTPSDEGAAATHTAAASPSSSPDTGASDGSGQGQPAADGQRPSRWENFKENHAQGIESVKDHASSAKTRIGEDASKAKSAVGDWANKHEGTVDSMKDKAHDFKEDHQDTIDAAKDKWHAFKEKHLSSQ